MDEWMNRLALVNINGSSGSKESSEILDKLSNCVFSRRILLYGVSCFVRPCRSSSG
jgi:hypothetical protein